MLKSLSPRAVLVASTALVAVAVVTLMPLGDREMPPVGGMAPVPAQAPQALDEVALEQSGQSRAQASPEPAPAASQTLTLGLIAIPGLNRGGPTVLPRYETDTEAFANADANPVHVTAETPVSTFSIDVDTASDAVVRNSPMNGYLPDADAVRIEEMVNYFPYAYPAPEGGAPFRVALGLMATPWNPGTRLLHVGIQGAMPAIEDRPPLNLVFLIDTSGSMQSADSGPLLRQSLAMMLGHLRAHDQIAIVAHAGSAGPGLGPTRAGDRDTIMRAMGRLQAGGPIAGAEGLRLAYRTAREMTGGGETGRVILATDGDFNVGISDPGGLRDEIALMRDHGTCLSVLGFGRGNLDDATMQALARNGNGQAAHIDTLNEARKVLVDQLSGALFVIADDVNIQVEFNPARVAEYRLIGYETRALRREDFHNDRIDAGDIGAGLQAKTSVKRATLRICPARARNAGQRLPARHAEGVPAA